jgi:hypothetical protein
VSSTGVRELAPGIALQVVIRVVFGVGDPDPLRRVRPGHDRVDAGEHRLDASDVMSDAGSPQICISIRVQPSSNR